MRKVSLCFFLASLSALQISCDLAEKVASAEALRVDCLRSLGQQAFENPATYPIAANFAGPLGLAPSSEADAPPYTTRQIQIGSVGQEMHFFAVDRPDWTKAVLARLTPGEQGARLTMFVIDQNGVVISAGSVERGELTILSIVSPYVLAESLREKLIWIHAGTSQSCRDLSQRLRKSSG